MHALKKRHLKEKWKKSIDLLSFLELLKEHFEPPKYVFYKKKTMHHAHTHKISHMCGSKERQTRCHFMYSASSLLHKILFFFVCAEIKKWRFFTFYLFFFVFLINCIAYNVVCTWTNGNKKVYASERDVLVPFLQFQLTTKNNQQEINFSRKEECQMTRESRLMSGVWRKLIFSLKWMFRLREDRPQHKRDQIFIVLWYFSI